MKKIDESIFKEIIEVCKKANNPDCLSFLAKSDPLKLYFEQKINQSGGNYNFKFITILLYKIQENDFNKSNYSTDCYK